MNKSFIQKYKIYLIAGAVITGVILFLLAATGIYYAHFLSTPAQKGATETTFVVNKGDGVRKIADNLEKEHILASDFPFLVYLKLTGLSTSIQAGDYILSGQMTPKTIADILTKGKVASKKITIPEGWTIDDIGTYLEKENVVKKADFIAATKLSYNNDFLTEKPSDSDVEGYLFPDTYQISVTADAEDIVQMMLDNFGDKLTPEIRAAIAGSDMNIHNVVTLSSIVEREVSKPEDRKVVAGIFLNRLDIGMALESCATIQYILKSDKPRFTYEETRVESPYNTYIHAGLPQGPIGNPGIDSIKAVLFPEQTSFLYFFSSKGTTYYSKTLDEHEEKIARYLD